MDEGEGVHGRTCCCGCCNSPKNFRLPGLTDSKLLSAAQRDELFQNYSELRFWSGNNF